jgi:hypothetical protein
LVILVTVVGLLEWNKCSCNQTCEVQITDGVDFFQPRVDKIMLDTEMEFRLHGLKAVISISLYNNIMIECL